MNKNQDASKKSKLYPHLLAIGSLAGTIIGLGMFGIPYVAMKAGIGLTFLYLLILGLVMAVVHMMYIEVTLRTNQTHRFVGYVGIYFGKYWKVIASFMSIITLWGSLLIYTIVGGEFINIILKPFLGDVLFPASLAFFALGAYSVARPPRTIGKIESMFTFSIVAIVFIFLAKGLWRGNIDYNNFHFADFSNWLLPYGVIMFAFGGFSIIPSIENILVKEIENKQKIHFGLIGIFGTLIPMIVYMVFMFSVVGITGAQTSKEALAGMEAVLGNGYVKIGALVGFFALFTSFIALGDELKRVFYDDYKIPYGISLFLTLFAPLVLFLFQILGFIQVMSFIGAVAGLFFYLFMIFMFYKAKRNSEMQPLFSFSFPKVLAWVIALIFVIGGVYNIIILI
jgi:amino acid permease